ncbi:MAG TPA: AMP-binding protein [Spirochaetia bacterium]|nr:AMP-binding protein [Spirochaetia bacterium]
MPGPEETIPKRVRTIVAGYADCPVMHAKNSVGEFENTSYGAMWKTVETLALALLDFGVKRGDHVGIMSDNRKEWLLTDLALLSIGAADVPRGSDSTEEEMGYILAHSDCALVFAENAVQVQKILGQSARAPELKNIVVFDEEYDEAGTFGNVATLRFATLLERGKLLLEARGGEFDREIDKGNGDDVATILYTSGTTGEPKGVLLPHRSYIFQIDRVKNILFLDENDIFLSVLPIWHSFERAVEYIVLGYAASIAYSKPNAKIMLADMAKIRPTWMTSVPRIWEGVRSAVFRNVAKEPPIKRALFHFFVAVGVGYANLSNLRRGLVPNFSPRSRILDKVFSAVPLLLLFPLKTLGNSLVFGSLKQRLGGRFVAGVSGGGALPPYVDSFFQAAGIKLLEGYGLTETGPVLAVRHEKGPVPGTVGPLLPDIEYRVVGENGAILGPNQKGVLHVRSPQVMLGYYKKPEESALVLKDGWLNTGDLVVFSHDGPFKVLGRVKETIVLLGGENVEPTPIEESLVQSEYIEQAMVVGQDKKFLAALIVPSFERLEEFAAHEGISFGKQVDLTRHVRVQELIHSEIHALVNRKRGFKNFEQIYRFRILTDSFEPGIEMTQTLKKKRDVIGKRYRKEIEALFKQ